MKSRVGIGKYEIKYWQMISILYFKTANEWMEEKMRWKRRDEMGEEMKEEMGKRDEIIFFVFWSIPYLLSNLS